MDLFNAATMGVDPKTGTYLSKEQRVAMFRASRGQGGGSDGGGKTPKGGNANVKPQSSLVIAEKMNGIVKSLSQNFKASTEGVAEQVKRNTQNIQNLYDLYEKQTAQEVKEEKKETRDQKLLAGEKTKKLRENMIEGMAKAAAKIAGGAGKLVGKALKPLESWWDKLKKALLYFSAAWVIKNLPAIREKITGWVTNLKDFQEEYLDSFTDIRGVYSIIDKALEAVNKTFKGIAKLGKKLAGKILNKAKDFAGKVTNAIGNFAKNVAGKIAKALLGIWQKALNLIPKKPPIAKPTPPPSGGGRTGAALAKTSQRAGGEVAKAGGGNPFSKIGNAIKGMMMPGGDPSTGKAKVPVTQAEKVTEGARVGWLKKTLDPIFQKFPIFKGSFGKVAKNLLRRVPVMGSIIDIMLNRFADNEGWLQAIVSGLASAGAGAIGWSGGSSLGFGLGAAIGAPIGGVGALVGAPVGWLLGGLVGSIAAGMIADNVVDAGFERFQAGDVPSGDYGSLGDALGSPMPTNKGSMDQALSLKTDHKVDANMPNLSKPTFSSSTPEGMGTLEDLYGSDKPELIDLPPIIKDMRTSSPQREERGEEAPSAPIIPTADREMDVIRAFSADEFMMVFS